jgi:hypothetical protein
MKLQGESELKNVEVVKLNEGEHFAGVVLGNGEGPDYYLVLLPHELHDATWADALEWAASFEGTLPNRRELSLLKANLAEKFEPVQYWSSEKNEHRKREVWIQHFRNGNQTSYGQCFRGSARAVRRVLM